MKKMTLLALALGMSCAAWSQTMKIHTGAVTVAVPAAEASKMTYSAGGTALTIMGKTYAVSEIDSITVDRSVVHPATVSVTYNGGGARLLVAGDIAPQLQVAVAGADVSVVAAPDLQKEVYYTLTGRTYDGTFVMDGDYKSTVTLDRLTLTNTDGPAIDIQNGKRIDVIIPDGTTSTLCDGKGLHKACFFVNGHPEFAGGGLLQLTGNAKHAFASDEYMRIKKSFGTLKVLKAEGDGLHVEQFFKMEGGELNIAGTKGDCIDVSFTKNPLDSLNGKAFIEAGKIKMEVSTPDTKGLKVDSIGELTLSGGVLEANVSGNGCKGISVGGNIVVQQKTAVPTVVSMVVSGNIYMPGDKEQESKCRGIRGKSNLTFDGGKMDFIVTGKKAKAIKLDGQGVQKSGVLTINGRPVNLGDI